MSRAKSAGDRPSPSGSPAPSPGGASPRNPGRTRKAVLVADDQLNVRNILEFNLKRRGFDVQVVHDGPSVLSTASAAAPDLVLLDIMMPGLDGFQVLEKLRANPETAAIPVLIVSARGSETDILRALQLGARDYVVKPFNLDVLFEKIQRALEDAGAEPAAAPEPFRSAAVLTLEFLDGPSIPSLVRRTQALARAGATAIVLDLSAAPVPDRAVLQRLVRLRDDLARDGTALRVVGPDETRAALDALEASPSVAVFARLAQAVAERGGG